MLLTELKDPRYQTVVGKLASSLKTELPNAVPVEAAAHRLIITFGTMIQRPDKNINSALTGIREYLNCELQPTLDAEWLRTYTDTDYPRLIWVEELARLDIHVTETAVMPKTAAKAEAVVKLERLRQFEDFDGDNVMADPGQTDRSTDTLARTQAEDNVEQLEQEYSKFLKETSKMAKRLAGMDHADPEYEALKASHERDQADLTKFSSTLNHAKEIQKQTNVLLRQKNEGAKRTWRCKVRN